MAQNLDLEDWAETVDEAFDHLIAPTYRVNPWPNL